MPRGKKKCPSCKAFCPSSFSSCVCGHRFLTKKNKAAPKSYFHERRKFISNMLGDSSSSNYAADMMVASKVFKKYDNDVDFLLGLRPPFQFRDSIVWLLGLEGKKFLERKRNEFDFAIEPAKEIIDFGVKEGEDKVVKTKTLRNFLDE